MDGRETYDPIAEQGNEEAASDGRLVSGRASLVAELKDFISRSPDILGAADILNIAYMHPLDRAGMLAAVLTGIATRDPQKVVREIVVLVPPKTDREAAQARVWDELLASFHLLAGSEMAVDDQEWLKARFKVSATSDRRSQSLLGLISTQPANTAVIIVDAGIYRDDVVEPYVAPGAATPLLQQDVWVPQVHALAAAAIDIAAKRNLYVSLDTNHLTPTREALVKLLLSIDGCGVMGSQNEEDLEVILAARVDRWDAWVRKGQIGQVFREIDDLPPAFDGEKAYLRIQILHRAGLPEEALRAIRREMTLEREIGALLRVKLARIAQDANASRLAVELLGPAVDRLSSLEELESALATAHSAGATKLEETISGRLADLFPGSQGIQQRERRALIAARDYAGVAAMLASQGDKYDNVMFFNRLAQFLSTSDIPDYLGLVSSAGSDIALADALRMACVRDALQRQLIVHAFDLVLPMPKTPEQAERGEKLLVEVLEAILLRAGSGFALPVPSKRVQAAVLALIDRLAADPTKRALRFGLARLVQPSVAGTAGVALMASVVLELASRPITLAKREAPGHSRIDWLLERKSFLEVALAWLEEQQPVVIGRIVLPNALLTEPADEIVSAITDYLNYSPVESDEDCAAVQLWLAFAATITPHSTDPDFDLRLMRLVGGKLVSSGRPQLARDLAEHALQNSAASPRRRRLGWFAMADVYHRCQNYLEGLLALACSLAADDVADEEQVWHEAIAVARFLRDSGLHGYARSAIRMAHKILDRLGWSVAYRHRLETLELQIRQAELVASKAGNAELESLLQDAVENAEAVLEHHDMTEPSAALVGQLLRFAMQRGATVPSNVASVLEGLREGAGECFPSLINLILAPSVSVSDLLGLVTIGNSTRYSDDVGYDMKNVAILAGRALADDRCLEDAVATSFALELLADRGVAAPGWDERAEPPPAPITVGEPAQIACSMSEEGLSVVQAGFDERGQLVRVSAVGGRMDAPVREPVDIICEERINAWAVEFPYRYGIDESTPNLFFTTTADLRLSTLPKGPVVVAADVTLQPFPPNLFFVDDDFAGRTRLMASVPSLAWLRASRERGPIGDGRLCAWISTAATGSESETLPMIAERLTPTFTEFGFIIDNGPTLPETFAGATTVVITAHGSVHAEGRYFQVVADEGVLRVAAGDLAGALRNVGTVILFVCSGGRADKHPDAHTILGLTKQILDRGSQAVVASPWPLDARVPSHWLPIFLEHWSKGESLIEANFAANKAVDRYFACDPARGLAMTVFGDPTIRHA